MSTKKAKPSYNYEIYIDASVDRVWRGLIDGELTKHYFYGTRFEGQLRKGAPYAYLGDGDFKVVDGEILDLEPQKRLEMSWQAHWDDSTRGERPSRVSYELAASGPETTKLRIVHSDFDSDESATYKSSVEGWPLILSSLKTLLESGRPLRTS